MAFDWIKLEHVTPDKPEIVRLADLLEIDQDAAFGKCVRFWIWCDQQTLDGNEIRVTGSFIDRLTNCPGFSERLLEVGWLKRRSNGFSVPNFERHNGQTAKNRALTKDRVKRSRNAKVVTKPPPDQDQEIEEEIDIKTNTKPMRTTARRNAPNGAPPEGNGVVGVYEFSITAEDLQDTGKVLDIAAQLLERKLSQAEQVGVLGIAERAIEKGENPGGFFRTLVTSPNKRDWKNISGHQDDRARRRLQQFQKEQTSSVKAMGNVLAGMAKGGGH